MSSDNALARLLERQSIVLTAGAGGVGKTSCAAALAIFAAVEYGREVLVVTIDPALRLADALGLSGIGNEPHEVDLGEFANPKGRLFASMVDMKASWDEMIHRCAPNGAAAQRIMSNPVYQGISSRFVQSHDYIAVEVLYELYIQKRFDLIVVDTPPSRHAIDFLDSPKKMEEFFSSRLLRWLTLSRRGRLFSGVFKPFYQIADRILGSAFLGDLSEFFIEFQAMHDGFVQRANAVTEILSSQDSSFVVVASAEQVAIEEALYFMAELYARDLSLGAVVLNRSLPQWLLDFGPNSLVNEMGEKAPELARIMAKQVKSLNSPSDVGETETFVASLSIIERVLREMANCYSTLATMKEREEDLRSRLGVDPELVMSAPHMQEEITSLSTLHELGAMLCRS